MGLFHYLFSFSGRINRAKQWAILLVGLVFGILLQVAFATLVGWGAVQAAFQNKTPFMQFVTTQQFHTFLVVAGIIYLVMIYIHLAVTTKRLHDRNKGAWWLLIFVLLPLVLNIPALMYLPQMFEQMITAIKAAQAGGHTPPPQFVQPPLVIISRGAASIISLWAFVELYCLRGTEGPNRFGSDPLAR
jgi:uncharacterized membrane protein YhaH (DUF805 family)